MEVIARRVALVFFLVCTARSHADAPAGELPLNTKALEHLQRGQARYDAKDYAAAIVEFRAGFAIEPKRVFLYALAQSERESGDCTSAIANYHEFLATDPPASMRTFAQEGLARCSETAAVPTPAQLPARPADETRWYRDGIGAALVGAGVGGLAIGGGFAWAARASAQRAATAPTLAAYDELAAQTRTRNRVALVGVVFGTALVGLGVTRYYLVSRDANVVVTSAGADVAFAWRF